MPCEQPDNPEDLDEVTACVNVAAADSSTVFIYTDHALERLGERQVNAELVARVLMEGRAISFESQRYKGRLQYRYPFQWNDPYGWLRVVARITRSGALVIISVIRD